MGRLLYRGQDGRHGESGQDSGHVERRLDGRHRESGQDNQPADRSRNRRSCVAAVAGFVLLTAALCWLLCLRHGIFGGKVDWISQHSVLPDYFRRQFYATGEWFPEFAANLGGGQNIYHFAYYGLYSPVVLLSYLLPFVKMSDYMMAAQFLSLASSVLLMYGWLGGRGFRTRVRVGVTLLFLLSGPMLFHSYNQIMFVNYMPFLILGLREVDAYFEDRTTPGGRRRMLLVLCIFLMIMTSFYFSICGMLVLAFYGMHRYLAVCGERGDIIRPGAFVAEGLRFLIPFLLAVLMSGFLLVPTALTLAGRAGSGGGAGFRLWELLIPQLPGSRICYSTYGIGLSTLALTALIALCFGRKLPERVLAVSCMAVLTIPLFAWLLNGGLYMRDKAMIPFLPLLCYLLACYLDGQERENRSGGFWNRSVGILPYLVTVALLCLCRRQGEAGKYWWLLVCDGVVMLACYTVYLIRKNSGGSGGICGCPSLFLLAPSLLMLAVFNFACHAQENRAVDREFYEAVTDPDIGEMIAGVTAQEGGFYRTEQLGSDAENAANLNRVWDMGQHLTSLYSSSYHDGYLRFREDTFGLEEPFRNFLMQSASRNPVYQRFMGVKYVVSKEPVPGYVPVAGKGEWKVYENAEVSPAVYATDRVMTEEAYQKLEFPYCQLALLSCAVVPESGGAEDSLGEDDTAWAYLAEVIEIKTELPRTVESAQKEVFRLKLPAFPEEDTGERVVFLRFRVENRKPSQDVSVWVEGVRNKLTAQNHFYYNANTEFTYAVLPEKGQKELEIVFGEGNYQISGVECYAGILPAGKNADQGLKLDKERTRGNVIAGTIHAEKQGYLITTIPYDAAFEIFVDGKPAEGEKVNTAFLGCKLEPGSHEVRLVYHAPGVKAGKLLSMAGFLLFVLWGALRAGTACVADSKRCGKFVDYPI